MVSEEKNDTRNSRKLERGSLEVGPAAPVNSNVRVAGVWCFLGSCAMRNLAGIMRRCEEEIEKQEMTSWGIKI